MDSHYLGAPGEQMTRNHGFYTGLGTSAPMRVHAGFQNHGFIGNGEGIR
jgi:hypothetical protein